MPKIRLDKYLADAGKGTRSQVKLLIKQGRVKIGEETAKKPEQKVDAEADNIYVDGALIEYAEYEYFMLNKPQGIISAAYDKREKTVVDLIAGDKRRDLFPVGRLDKDTEGLLLITNDGKLANELLAPKKHVDKTYYAVIAGDVTPATIKSFADGLDIGDENLTKPAKLKIVAPQIENLEITNVNTSDTHMAEQEITQEKTQSDTPTPISHVEITITEGRYHQIKRMFEAVNMKVLYLKRLSMGNLNLDKNLKLGEYRKLTAEELKILLKLKNTDNIM